MSKEIGTLVVVVLKARNLRDKHTFHKQDAFAQAILNKTTKKTRVEIKAGQHPVWDEEIRFPVYKDVSDESRKLEVSCWSKEPRTDDCIGKGSVDISETLRTGEFDEWVPLLEEDGGYRGELFLEMTYYSATPPLQRRASKFKPTERLERPSTAYSYAPLPPALTAGQRPQAHGPGRSPVKKNDALPPLPEEPPAAAQPAPVPTALRPGGNGNKRTSPSPIPVTPPSEPAASTYAPVSPPRNSVPLSFPEPNAPSVPVTDPPSFLRPGAGAASYEATPPRPVSGAYQAPPYETPQVRPAPAVYPPAPYQPPYQAPYQPPYQPPYQAPYQASSYQAPQYQPPVARPSSAYQAPTSVYQPPPPRAMSSYTPYNGYAPPPADPEPLPDPYLEARYQTPLPLPPGATHKPRSASKPSIEPKREERKEKQESAEERDRILALVLEREEEERQRRLREQEEKDIELARKLDLELNI